MTIQAKQRVEKLAFFGLSKQAFSWLPEGIFRCTTLRPGQKGEWKLPMG
jgi:hypothetical protein